LSDINIDCFLCPEITDIPNLGLKTITGILQLWEKGFHHEGIRGNMVARYRLLYLKIPSQENQEIERAADHI
jgi:hypothetical protein